MFNEILKNQLEEIMTRTEDADEFQDEFENIVNANYELCDGKPKDYDKAYYFKIDENTYLGYYQFEYEEIKFVFLVKDNKITFASFSYPYLEQIKYNPHLFKSSLETYINLLDFKNMYITDFYESNHRELKWGD